MTDSELLKVYAEGGGEAQEAFAALVGRHRDWVYSVCLRGTGNGAMAEDAAQAVFLALARKANRVSKQVSVAGWLYCAAQYAARDAVKLERRRVRREAEVATMNKGAAETDALAWEQIAPELERALDQLPEKLRVPILMRFYQRMTHGEIAAALQVSEAAVQKRVERGLERLGKGLARRGVRTPAGFAAGLGAVMLAHGVLPAPASLGAMATAGAAVAPPSLTVLALMKGVSQMGMTMVTKMAVAAVVVLAVGATSAVVMHTYAAAPTHVNGGGLVPVAADAIAAPAAAANGKIVSIDLAPGLSVDVLGLTEDSSGGAGGEARWWSPDGTPMDQPGYGKDVVSDLIRASLMRGKADGVVMREAAVRVRQKTEDGKEPADVRLYMRGDVPPPAALRRTGVPGGRGGGGRGVIMNTNSITQLASDPEMRAVIGLIGGDPQTATLVVQAAIAPWWTALHAPAEGGTLDIQGRPVTVQVGAAVNGNTPLSLEFTDGGTDIEERVMVLDTDLQWHKTAMDSMSMKSNVQGAQRTVEYHVTLPPQKIKEIQYQTRTWEPTIEVRNLSMKAGSMTRPQVAKAVTNPRSPGTLIAPPSAVLVPAGDDHAALP